MQTRAVCPVFRSSGSAHSSSDDENEDAHGNAIHVLCPVVDLANHESGGLPSATIELDRMSLDSDASGELVIKLVSFCGLAIGSEITICYNKDLDFLDLFEIYVSGEINFIAADTYTAKASSS